MIKRAYKKTQGPRFPLAVGTKAIPNLRKNVGVALNVYGEGPKRRLRKAKKVLGQVNDFLKKSKLISTVGAPLAALLPPGYNVAAEGLVGVARNAGYGKRGRPKKMMGGARANPSALRRIKEGLKKVDAYLKKTQIISKIGNKLNKHVPKEYKVYSDAGLAVAKNLGYGKMNKGMLHGRAMLGNGMLRNQKGMGMGRRMC